MQTEVCELCSKNTPVKVKLNKNSSWLEFVYLTNDLRAMSKKKQKNSIKKFCYKKQCDVSVCILSPTRAELVEAPEVGNNESFPLKLQWRLRREKNERFSHSHIHNNTQTVKTHTNSHT